jgi:hypothetical protein
MAPMKRRVAEREKTIERAKEEIYNAYAITNRYHLFRDWLLAAGFEAEAAQAELKRRALVALWKWKLSGGNDAELFLR